MLPRPYKLRLSNSTRSRASPDPTAGPRNSPSPSRDPPGVVAESHSFYPRLYDDRGASPWRGVRDGNNRIRQGRAPGRGRENGVSGREARTWLRGGAGRLRGGGGPDREPHRYGVSGGLSGRVLGRDKIWSHAGVKHGVRTEREVGDRPSSNEISQSGAHNRGGERDSTTPVLHHGSALLPELATPSGKTSPVEPGVPSLEIKAFILRRPSALRPPHRPPLFGHPNLRDSVNALLRSSRSRENQLNSTMSVGC